MRPERNPSLKAEKKQTEDRENPVGGNWKRDDGGTLLPGLLSLTSSDYFLHNQGPTIQGQHCPVCWTLPINSESTWCPKINLTGAFCQLRIPTPDNPNMCQADKNPPRTNTVCKVTGNCSGVEPRTLSVPLLSSKAQGLRKALGWALPFQHPRVHGSHPRPWDH